jgi:hypothetical protein
MSSLCGARDSYTELQNLWNRDSLGSESGCKVWGRAVLHHQVRTTVGTDARTVDGDDRRVAGKLGHHVRLGVEQFATLTFGGLTKDLDRHTHGRHRLLVEEDLREAALADRLDEGESVEVRCPVARRHAKPPC